MEQSDRRIFERNKARIRVSYLDAYTDLQDQAIACDISAKGLKIMVGRELAERTGLELWLNLPESPLPFYTRGEVVWSKPEGEGKWLAGILLEKADFISWPTVKNPPVNTQKSQFFR